MFKNISILAICTSQEIIGDLFTKIGDCVQIINYMVITII